MNEDRVEWEVRLWERDPGRRYVVLAAAFSAGAFGLLLLNHWVFGLIGVAVILASTQEFLLPLRFRLTEQTARVKCGVSVTEIEWEKVRRIVIDAGGVKLSPLSRDLRVGVFRGVYLRFGDRERVLAGVERFAPREAERILEDTPSEEGPSDA